jgi:hypothetical protein
MRTEQQTERSLTEKAQHGEKTKMMKKVLIATLATMWISVAAFAAPITYRLSTPGVV